ncbi:MAG: DUF2726 domain-containing protein [Litorimonas sp.]
MTAFLLILAVCALGFFASFLKSGPKTAKTRNKPSNKRIPFEKYELTSAINNGAEAKLFHSLLAYAGQWGCHVLVKPRLEDVIRVKPNMSGKEKFSLRGRVKSRHLDFLIVDPTGRPLAGVELDGPSHNQASAKASDRFKDNLANSVGLPLHRVLWTKDPQTAAYDIFTALYYARQAA